jgi:hypothetical protein
VQITRRPAEGIEYTSGTTISPLAMDSRSFLSQLPFPALTRLGIDTARFRDMARRRPPRQLQQSDIGASY